MPRPAYVMFADSGSVDHHTNRVSLFDVVEVFNVALRKPEEGAQAPPPMLAKPQRITAVWLREAGDTNEDQFEGQIACLSPDGTELFHSEVSPFKFTVLFQRFDIPAVQIPGFISLGIHTVEARLRRAGQQEWQWRQSFPFVVQEIVLPTPTAPLPPEAPPA